MSQSTPSRLRCRQIQIHDLDSIIELLMEGFPTRTRKYWTTGFARIQDKPPPEGAPRFGYMLENDGAPVGVLLLIFTGLADEPEGAVCINVSSWYVKPEFRANAALLVTLALKQKNAIYLNSSPMVHTLPLLKALGFQLLTRGQFLSVPLLSWSGGGARVVRVTASRAQDQFTHLADYPLLRDHAAMGCVSLLVADGAGWAPFVFLPRHIRYAPLPAVQLVYCRQTADLARFAGAIGRALLGAGYGLVICDSDGPVPGLVGRYFDGKMAKYYKGPAAPRINDLAYSEAIVFGL